MASWLLRVLIVSQPGILCKSFPQCCDQSIREVFQLKTTDTLCLPNRIVLAFDVSLGQHCVKKKKKNSATFCVILLTNTDS